VTLADFNREVFALRDNLSAVLKEIIEPDGRIDVYTSEASETYRDLAEELITRGWVTGPVEEDEDEA
jgi:hypothetical protein